MNKGLSISKLYFLLVLILSLTSIPCLSQTTQPFSINESPLGPPTSPVMDYAGILDAGTKQALEKRIIEFRDRTNPSVELAVAIVQTTGERPIFDYSLAVARGWKIGSKEDDNPSALLFIAIGDRKYFTQISKDLEDELPDGLAGQLQRQYLVPAFRQGNYGKGISDTIEAYIRTIEAKQTGAPVSGTTKQGGKPIGRANRNNQRSGGFCGTMVCLIILFIVLISFFSRFGSNSRGRGGRRGSGWRGGGFGGSAVPWIVGSIIANSINSRGSSGGWGGGSSGGSGWGGFGGGGDFGGGGAGGDW